MSAEALAILEQVAAGFAVVCFALGYLAGVEP